jgi:hypothetical protein
MTELDMHKVYLQLGSPIEINDAEHSDTPDIMHDRNTMVSNQHGTLINHQNYST